MLEVCLCPLFVPAYNVSTYMFHVLSRIFSLGFAFPVLVYLGGMGEGGEEEMLGKICGKHFHTEVSSIVLFFVSSLLQNAAVQTT